MESGELRENYDELNLVFGPTVMAVRDMQLHSGGDPTRVESIGSDEVGTNNKRFALYKEPVLTVAALNEIFKSQENVDVFEIPHSEHTYDEDDDSDEKPNLATSIDQRLMQANSFSISP